jgi:hypothetical protein
VGLFKHAVDDVIWWLASCMDPAKNYIFVEFLHGVVPMSELVAGGPFSQNMLPR